MYLNNLITQNKKYIWDSDLVWWIQLIRLKTRYVEEIFSIKCALIELALPNLSLTCMYIRNLENYRLKLIFRYNFCLWICVRMLWVLKGYFVFGIKALRYTKKTYTYKSIELICTIVSGNCRLFDEQWVQRSTGLLQEGGWYAGRSW